LLTLALGSPSAYTVARLRLRWVMWLMNLNVFARFVPVIVVMIPLYVRFRQLGLLNSIWGVIIALTGFLLPYGVVIRWLLTLRRVSARHPAALDPGPGTIRIVFIVALPRERVFMPVSCLVPRDNTSKWHSTGLGKASGG
jgi:ABC-type glycerol-3-phosphate transport system permease component